MIFSYHFLCSFAYLFLQLAISIKLYSQEIVKALIIFSGMGFDQCGRNDYEIDHQLVKRKFEQASY